MRSIIDGVFYWAMYFFIQYCRCTENCVCDDTFLLVKVSGGRCSYNLQDGRTSGSPIPDQLYTVRIKSCHATLADASSLSIIVIAGSTKVPTVWYASLGRRGGGCCCCWCD